MNDQISLFYKKVVFVEEAEMLRVIRNACCEYMTRNTEIISPESQRAWFRTAHDKYDLYLVYAMEHGAVVVLAGYGVIHKNRDESLVTGGFLPDYRNRGLGHDLFKFLTDTAIKRMVPVRLEVLKTNLRALKVYEKLDYVVYDETDKIYKMEYKYDSVV